MTATSNTLAIAAAVISAAQCFGGFITIDEFTDATKSDGHGVRTFTGDVKVADDAASLVSGVVWLGEVASINYSFMPSPLVVKPKFVLTLRNNQTSYAESGVLRATVNGGQRLERELFAAKNDYEIVVFDFAGMIPQSETISEFRLDWLRPDIATGARELLIDSIVVADVPEPPTFALIATCLAGVGCYQMNKVQKEKLRRMRFSKPRKRR